MRRSARRDRRGRQHHRPIRPGDGTEPRADPIAAGGRVCPSPPRARGHALARRDHPRVGRAARGASLRHAARLRRERDQPVSDARDARLAGLRRADHASRAGRPRGLADARAGRPEHDQGDRQRAAEDDLQDGHLHDPVLLRRADLRGRRPGAGADRQALHRHGLTDRRGRPGGAGDRGAGAPRARLADAEHRQWCRYERAAASRRRLRVAARRRAPHLEPRDDRARAACRACGQRQCRRGAAG